MAVRQLDVDGGNIQQNAMNGINSGIYWRSAHHDDS